VTRRLAPKGERGQVPGWTAKVQTWAERGEDWGKRAAVTARWASVASVAVWLCGSGRVGGSGPIGRNKVLGF
jgi:hypothetical protein